MLVFFKINGVVFVGVLSRQYEAALKLVFAFYPRLIDMVQCKVCLGRLIEDPTRVAECGPRSQNKLKLRAGQSKNRMGRINLKLDRSPSLVTSTFADF